MDDLDTAIEAGQEKVRGLEKEVQQANELLTQAQQELRVLLGARQIILKARIRTMSDHSEEQLPLKDVEVNSPIRIRMHEHIAVRDGININLREDGTIARERPRDMTLVQEVLEIIAGSPGPIGPSEIRFELEKTKRSVPQNVMTGLLSRLTKERRIIRLERGKYVALEEREPISHKQTA